MSSAISEAASGMDRLLECGRGAQCGRPGRWWVFNGLRHAQHVLGQRFKE